MPARSEGELVLGANRAGEKKHRYLRRHYNNFSHEFWSSEQMQQTNCRTVAIAFA
jgi:hypothetical protein